jgi:hypothetical protein
MDTPGGVAVGFRAYDTERSLHVIYDPSATSVTAMVRRKGQRTSDEDLTCVEEPFRGIVPGTDADGNHDLHEECILTRDLTKMVPGQDLWNGGSTVDPAGNPIMTLGWIHPRVYGFGFCQNLRLEYQTAEHMALSKQLGLVFDEDGDKKCQNVDPSTGVGDAYYVNFMNTNAGFAVVGRSPSTLRDAFYYSTARISTLADGSMGYSFDMNGDLLVEGEALAATDELRIAAFDSLSDASREQVIHDFKSALEEIGEMYYHDKTRLYHYLNITISTTEGGETITHHYGVNNTMLNEQLPCMPGAVDIFQSRSICDSSQFIRDNIPLMGGYHRTA